MLAYILSANGICALLTALGLLVVTVAIHTLGLDALLRVMIRAHALNLSGFHRVTPWVFGMACFHLIEISVWGLFYVWQGCLPDAETALYFSGITYTTVGYGDLVLLKPWRMLARAFSWSDSRPGSSSRPSPDGSATGCGRKPRQNITLRRNRTTIHRH